MAKKRVPRIPINSGSRRSSRSTSSKGIPSNCPSASLNTTFAVPPCDPNPQQVQVVSSCEEPVFVELCPNSIGIETAMAELGCIVDDDGEIIGKVMLCKITDEEDGSEIIKQTAYFEDGTIIQDYSGPWAVCAPDVCVPEPFLGVITDLSLLTA